MKDPICKKYDISAGNFYKWQEKFLKAALEGFKKSDDGPTKAELRKIEQQAQKKSGVVNPILRLEIIADIESRKKFDFLSLNQLLSFYEIKKSTYHGWVSFRSQR